MSDTPRTKLSAKHPRTLDKTRAPVRSSGALSRPTKAVPASMLDASGAKKKPAAKPARPRPVDNAAAPAGARRPAGSTAAPRKPAAGSTTPYEKRSTGERPPARGQRERVAGARPARLDDESRPRRAAEGGARGDFARTAKRGPDDRAPRRFDEDRPRRAPEGGARGDFARPAKRGPDDRAPRRFDEDRPRRAPEGGARGDFARPAKRGPDDRAPRRFDEDRPRRAAEGGARGDFARPAKRGPDDRAPRRFDEDRPRRAPESGARGDFARPAKRGPDDRAQRRFDEDRPRRAAEGNARGEGAPGGRFARDDRDARTARPARPARVARDADDDVKIHHDAAGSLRLSKRMSELGLSSRREADEWIAKGWVRVDGKVVTELGTKILPTQEITVVQAARKEQANRMTILLHKPVGYVSAQAEDGYEPAVVLVTREHHWAEDDAGVRFSPSHLRSLAPAGRLDIDSTGLLVLTQDGRIAKQLIGEDSDIEKEYLVRVSYNEHVENVQAHFPADRLALLRHGLELDDQPLKPAQVEWQNPEQLRFVLKEGKKRQIRRMCELVGLHVTGLKRVRMGRITLGNLPVGEWRYLRAGEGF
ncbi:pseudouridine synthase [Pandoraea cepalis]|uniref:Dual-specificity RNA pseudouridine synthase RluF n=1 Tax=Pandoraea cepalis TaxID=2508294 RepID=A0AAW7MIB9_9BURK|nr:pseudouridine synthase [Pandoraea cepalis]MDN4572499.1 pseudouridine synthase [Pandoraea cepalis]MDN4577425.1 pseudouridine synthase [Pandoraea cepalis]